jgi:hypothetical protein
LLARCVRGGHRGRATLRCAPLQELLMAATTGATVHSHAAPLLGALQPHHANPVCLCACDWGFSRRVRWAPGAHWRVRFLIWLAAWPPPCHATSCAMAEPVFPHRRVPWQVRWRRHHQRQQRVWGLLWIWRLLRTQQLRLPRRRRRRLAQRCTFADPATMPDQASQGPCVCPHASRNRASKTAA